VARFVERGDFLLFVANNVAAAFRPHHYLVTRFPEIFHPYFVFIASSRQQRRFVNKVHQVGAGEVGRTPRYIFQIDIIGKGDVTRVHFQYSDTAAQVGPIHNYLAVKTAGAQQRRIEYIGPVGRRQHYYALIGFKPVHLDE